MPVTLRRSEGVYSDAVVLPGGTEAWPATNVCDRERCAVSSSYVLGDHLYRDWTRNAQHVLHETRCEALMADSSTRHTAFPPISR